MSALRAANAVPEQNTTQKTPVREATPLRFITCGSVDDGKSTLIGRLLWDTKMVPEDQADAARPVDGNQAGQLNLPDFANLLDGLQAEREQGITIDVAYRYFSTPNRSFIVADTPGHEQYTRNMATGASTADLAVVLVDARSGILEQTIRHATIVSLMGISQIVLAVNKIDLVDYSQNRFEQICTEFSKVAAPLGIKSVTAIPTSAVKGENVASPSPSVMPWYDGPTLLQMLEMATKRSGQTVGFRLPVQRVCRPDESFRGYQGTIAGGAVKPGDSIVILPSGETANVTKIVTLDLVRNAAVAGDAVTLVLDRQVDISRGDMIASIDARPDMGSAFDATLMVLDSAGLKNRHKYWLKSGSRMQRVTIDGYQVLDLKSQDWIDAHDLEVNRIVGARLHFSQEAVFDRYADNRQTGSFILIDPETNNTVAGGMISGPTSNVVPISHDEGDMTAIIVPAGLEEELRALITANFSDPNVELLKVSRQSLSALRQARIT